MQPQNARFARIVFVVAGIWGLVVVTPLYFMYDVIGRRYPPPLTHPDFYYGFLGVTLTWQFAFLLIATDPVRFRPLIAITAVEKFTYVATLATLYARGELQFGQAAVGIPDCVLGVLFVVAFMRTTRVAAVSSTEPQRSQI